MKKEEYIFIENYMKKMMSDSAHDYLHIYRVLNNALKISKNYEVDMDVLIAGCLLHDIGRDMQFKNPNLCHAIVGGKIAYEFLLNNGWNEKKALHVCNIISTHRFRSNNQPQTIEAKILFDADKLDVIGAIGIARSLMYKGDVKQPLYTVNDDLTFDDYNDKDAKSSFFREYNFKLKKLYDKFYTKEAYQIAKEKEKIAIDFYKALYQEVDLSDFYENIELEIK